MRIDKLQIFVTFSLVVFSVALFFFVRTTLRPPAEEFIKNQADTASRAVLSNHSGIPSLPNVSGPISPDLPESEIMPDWRSSFEDDLDKASQEDLTVDEILALIEDMQTERKKLHQAMEHKRKLSDLAREQGFDLDDEFQAIFDKNLRERQSLTEDFEHHVLNGASLDKTSQTATPEELDELQSRPEAQSLLEALFQEKAIGKQWESQSKALADEANRLTAEYAAIYQQILEIDKSITELSAMLE